LDILIGGMLGERTNELEVTQRIADILVSAGIPATVYGMFGGELRTSSKVGLQGSVYSG